MRRRTAGRAWVGPKSAHRAPVTPANIQARLSARKHRIASFGVATSDSTQAATAVDADGGATIGKQHWTGARGVRVTRHAVEIGADVWRKVDLVNDEEVGVDQSGTLLAGRFVARGDVEDVDAAVGEGGTEG